MTVLQSPTTTNALVTANSLYVSLTQPHHMCGLSEPCQCFPAQLKSMAGKNDPKATGKCPCTLPDRTQLTCIELSGLGTGIRSTSASEPFLQRWADPCKYQYSDDIGIRLKMCSEFSI